MFAVYKEVVVMGRIMSEEYGEPDDDFGGHILCPNCGMCIDCNDCTCKTPKSSEDAHE